eukprot:351992-Chlamydomonas_euryale.AAC.2
MTGVRWPDPVQEAGAVAAPSPRCGVWWPDPVQGAGCGGRYRSSVQGAVVGPSPGCRVQWLSTAQEAVCAGQGARRNNESKRSLAQPYVWEGGQTCGTEAKAAGRTVTQRDFAPHRPCTKKVWAVHQKGVGRAPKRCGPCTKKYGPSVAPAPGRW